MIELSTHLQAKNPERNIARYYSLFLAKDLLGFWMLRINFGRIGRSQGQEIAYAFSSKEEAYQRIKPILKKRASAQNRLGCCYDLVRYYRHPSLKDLEVLPLLFEGKKLRKFQNPRPLKPKPKKSRSLPLLLNQNHSLDVPRQECYS